MAEMRPAAEMKDSGIEWVGQIPQNWNRTKISRCFRLIGSGTTPKSNNDLYYDGDINWLQSGDINGGVVDKTKKHITEEAFQAFSTLKIYSAPFIAIAMYGASIANTSIVNIDACTNQACCVLSSVKNTSDFKYVFYTLQAAKSELLLSGRGGTQPNISQEIIKNLIIPIPPIVEQQAIADYLDDRCSKIDEIIEEATASIEEYKELKQAVIFEAVTKGLDKSVPMKDSGIEWLPYVPEHWDVRRIATIYDESKETGRDDLPILLVSIHTGISDREIDNEERDRKVIRSEDKTIYKVVHKNYLAYNMMRAWQGGFGAAAIDGLVSPAYVVAKPKIEVNTAYIENVLRTPNAIEHIRGMSYGVADFRLRLYWPYFKNIRVPFPSIEEQNRIVEYIKNHLLKFDSLISEKQSLISDLQAYKKSLIYEVVTGKRRVV